jgi:predicted ATPase/class 3 adenylate cyclase
MPSLPTGTVTFLFTDIEGSTRLLDQLKDAYVDVLAECRRLIRTAVQERGGQEVDTEGDAFFAVFPSVREGLLAAVSAQQHILRHPWPDVAAVRLRMGLHTGEARIAEGGYVGMDVHRSARICAAAHGGQILLSETISALVMKDLPKGVGLRDLGEHRLKDLIHPHHLFQIVAAGLPTDFPPIRSLDVLPNNLPRQLTSFIGREKEMAEVKRLLSTAYLVTLTGSGGAGKTRLALQVAAEMVDDYPDGVWLAEFAPIADPALVPKTVASALNVPEQPGRAMTETLVDALRPKALLLVLDNCEHLLAACRGLIAALLSTCPEVRILATSREGLGVPGEALWRVPSLSLPEDIFHLPPPEGLVLYDAVRLFVDRAVAAAQGFTVTSENAPAVALVCQRLDGIPLAIELAAARVKVLAVEQIAARLDDRFRLLTGGSPTLLPRQQTLRATLDWSYGLLSDQERTLLRRLSVFAGGWTLDAAEAVCAGGGIEASDILDLLTQLVDKSLVVAETQRGEARYRLLETVRQYGWDRLVELSETADVRTRHRDWYLHLAERADPKLRGPEQGVWGRRLEAEHDNLRAALEWSKTEEGDADAWLRLAGALHWFWFMRNYLSEGRERLEEALATNRNASVPARANVLCGAGTLAWRQGDIKRAEILLQESLALFRKLGENSGMAFSLHHLAHVAERQRDFREATVLFDESLARFKEAGNTWGGGLTLECMGGSALLRGDYDGARALLEESSLIYREVGESLGLSLVLRKLGTVAEQQGDYERATALLEQGLALARQSGGRYAIPGMQQSLGDVALRRGDCLRAAALYRESLIQQRGVGDKPGITRCLEGLAAVACARSRYGEGARILGAAEALREATGFQPAPFEQADHDHLVVSVRATLGDAAFAAAWSEGRAMTLEQAIEYALAAGDE